MKELLKMFRYVHTNIIAKDANRLIGFYKTVFHCENINGTRDLRGEWLDKLTGLSEAHITGEHLLLPGYNNEHPTLEIFSYDTLKKAIPAEDLSKDLKAGKAMDFVRDNAIVTEGGRRRGNAKRSYKSWWKCCWRGCYCRLSGWNTSSLCICERSGGEHY
jgi:hypothetical protein